MIAAILRAAGGDGLVVSVAPGQTPSVSDCARWLAAHPQASSCRTAAQSDWAAETVYYRLAVGVLGLLMLSVLAWRYRRRAVSDTVLLPALAVNAVACTLFLLAGVWTLGSAIDAVIVADGAGSGQWFSAAPVALAAAVGFGWRGLQNLRRPEQTDPPTPARHDR